MIKKHFIKLSGLALVATIVMGMSTTALAAETQADADLQIEYENVMFYADKHGIDLNMTYDDFLSNYSGQSVQSYYSILVSSTMNNARSSSSSGGSTYYYNTGYSCPSKAKYSKYNLLNVVKKVILFMKQTVDLASQGISLSLMEFTQDQMAQSTLD